jgi:hypothetical protein
MYPNFEPLDPALRQMNPVDTSVPGCPVLSLPFRVSVQNFVRIFSSLCVFHIPPDFMILIIFDEQYKLWSSSLCSFLHPHVASSLFGTDVLSILLLNTLNICSLRWESKFRHMNNNNSYYSSEYFNLCAFSQQTGRQILKRILVTIPRI